MAWAAAVETPLGPLTWPGIGAHAAECHPFLHYRTGNVPEGSQAEILEAGGPSGYIDAPPGTARVVCLGGSTTVTGYPDLMEQALTRLAPERTWEAINLADSSWTSAHNLVHYALRGRYWRPAYVVLHHGWNDSQVRGAGEDFRTDYAHVFQCLPEQSPLAAALTGRSATVGLLSRWSMGKVRWETPAQNRVTDADVQENWTMEGLVPFRANTEAIAIAIADGAVPVLATVCAWDRRCRRDQTKREIPLTPSLSRSSRTRWRSSSSSSIRPITRSTRPWKRWRWVTSAAGEKGSKASSTW